ncbi:MAG: asparaginase [Pseudomonadota bacterium]
MTEHEIGSQPVLAEVWRGPVLECVHRGSAVVCRPDGEVVAAWGDPDRRILPRSSCKMVQALPLVESGAADIAGLEARHLALACASHNGAGIHTGLAGEWLAGLGFGEADLRCGSQVPNDDAAIAELAERAPSQLHNNCSGKHSGMLTLGMHLNAGPEYIEPDHPVQLAVRQATAETAGEEVTDFATDGCSAPNFVVSLTGLATQMARFAVPQAAFSGARADAATRLVAAMMAHPELVAGEGRACTTLMRACGGRAAVKTGAEGVFVGILPEAGLGIALKIDDGATRGSHAAIAALLVRYGALEAGSPAWATYADAPLLNRRGIDCGRIRAAETLSGAT